MILAYDTLTGKVRNELTVSVLTMNPKCYLAEMILSMQLPDVVLDATSSFFIYIFVICDVIVIFICILNIYRISVHHVRGIPPNLLVSYIFPLEVKCDMGNSY